MKLVIGDKYFVRGSSKDYVGILTEIDGPKCVSLKNAAWVADSGRLNVFMSTGKAPDMEIEMMHSAGSIWYEEIWEWPHELFTESV